MFFQFPPALIPQSAFRNAAMLAAFLFLSACSLASSDTPPAQSQPAQSGAAPSSQSNGSGSGPAPSSSGSGSTTYAPPAGSVNAKLQVGPWFPMPANIEEPFINIFHASAMTWRNDEESVTTEQLFDGGHIDTNTGLLTSFPAGASSIYTTVYFTSENKRVYDGDWVLEWDGDADVELEFLPIDEQTAVGTNRIEFRRSVATPYHSRIRVTRLGPGGLTGLRMFRAENEDRLDSGKIYARAFIDNVSRGHVVRTMDMQEANRAFIHRSEQVAPLGETFWNNFTLDGGAFAPHKSMPLEAVAALGVEADVEIWHHAPMELGAPKDFTDPTIMSGSIIDWADNVYDMISADVATALASSEWDEYADDFVAALDSAGYPEARPLYTTLSNEVWNFAYHYHITTHYAWGAGVGYAGGEPGWHYRHGYGVFMGRWMLALEGALARVGRNQNVVYLIEAQAANTATSGEALNGMKTYIEDQGQTWDDYNDKVGVSVASYWGGQGYYSVFSDLAAADMDDLHTRYADEVASDPSGMAKRLADFYIDGPADVIATKAWILDRFEGHNSTAETYGVRFVGAYEGGSHDETPEFFRSEYGPDETALRDWWRDEYLWSAQGARVNNAVNDAIAEAYPGFILSNYVTVGVTGGQPWFDGVEGEDNAMQISWTKYYRQ